MGIDLLNKGDGFTNQNILPIHLFLSHYHVDHIEGLGFLKQAFNPNAKLNFYAESHGEVDAHAAIARRQDHPYFPIQMHKWPAQIKFNDIIDGQVLQIGNTLVEIMISDHGDKEYLENAPEQNGTMLEVGKMNHPNGGSSTYKLSLDGKTFVYATDVEVKNSQETHEKLLRMCYKVDLLVIDAQYTEEEYAGIGTTRRVGWGHNDFKTAIDVGIEAKVSRIRLTHHEPEHDDNKLREIEREAISYAKSKGSSMEVLLARERMTIDL